MHVIISVFIVACVVVALDTASAQEAPAVDTHVIARTATDQGTYHYAQIFQQRGRWILPDVGYIDFNEFDEYREVWVGAGGVLLATTHLSVVGEGHIVKALGPSSGGALYLQPWVLVAYHLTHKLGGEAVYFPYLPLNDAGRGQHVLERARLLRRTRRGREHRCRIDPAPLRDAGAVLVKLAGFWEGQLASLDRWLASTPEK